MLSLIGGVLQVVGLVIALLVAVEAWGTLGACGVIAVALYLLGGTLADVDEGAFEIRFGKLRQQDPKQALPEEVRGQ